MYFNTKTNELKIYQKFWLEHRKQDMLKNGHFPTKYCEETVLWVQLHEYISVC